MVGRNHPGWHLYPAGSLKRTLASSDMVPHYQEICRSTNFSVSSKVHIGGDGYGGIFADGLDWWSRLKPCTLKPLFPFSMLQDSGWLGDTFPALPPNSVKSNPLSTISSWAAPLLCGVLYLNVNVYDAYYIYIYIFKYIYVYVGDEKRQDYQQI